MMGQFKRLMSPFGRYPLLLLRIFSGYHIIYWVYSASETPWGEILVYWITRQGEARRTSEWFKWYADLIYADQQQLVGCLLIGGLLVAGVCLILGLATRFAAAFAVFVCINIALFQGYSLFGVHQYSLMLVCCLVIAFCKAEHWRFELGGFFHRLM